MNHPKKTINTKKLTKEILVCLFVVIAISVVIFIMNALQPKSDPFEEHKKLYNIVVNYDYSKGRDENLEKRMDRAIDNSSATRYYFNLKAKLYYFYKFKNYHLVASNLDELYRYVVSPAEQKELLEWYIKVYTRFGNQEKVSAYQERYRELYNREFDAESAILAEDTNI